MMSPNDCERLLGVLKKDCEFFEKMNIIDYSLLIGEHVISSESQLLNDGSIDLTESIVGVNHQVSFKEKPNVIVSADKKRIYFLGIIDILTLFNKKKKSEFLFKKAIYGKGVSCVPSKEYSSRLQKFIKGSIIPLQ